MQEYKRLEQLCNDLLRSERGVTAYIDAMDECGYAFRNIPEWENDYKALKNYRHIRNQISHEPDAEESELCTYSDEVWLRNFYERIMNRNDPLALYERYKKSEPQRRKIKTEQKTNPYADMKFVNAEPDEPQHKNGLVIALSIGIVALLIGIVIVAFFLIFLIIKYL